MVTFEMFKQAHADYGLLEAAKLAAFYGVSLAQCQLWVLRILKGTTK